MGRETPVLFQLGVRCLLSQCMQSTECRLGKGPLVSAIPPISWSSEGCLDLKAHDFIHSRWTLWARKFTYLEVKRTGALGCLQRMAVTPMMSSSSSTATVVSTGSPENTWLGHGARITLRMVSRGTARVKVEENRLDSRSQRRQDLRLHPSPGCPHQEGTSYLQDSSTDKIHTPTLSCQF